VLGVDESYLNLPHTEETQREFRVQTNQPVGGEQVQALASVLYDLRNDVGLSVALGPKQAEKNLLFGTHLAATQAGDVLVCDRAYADYSVVATVVARQQLPTTLRVRLLKVVLASGAVEVLGTDLLDAQTYPAAEFKAVYGWRWQHETHHDRIKNIFEVERFSGKSVQAIKQDVYGVIFLATVESIRSKLAQAVLTAPHCRQIS
jgi:hypothetical protein